MYLHLYYLSKVRVFLTAIMRFIKSMTAISFYKKIFQVKFADSLIWQCLINTITINHNYCIWVLFRFHRDPVFDESYDNILFWIFIFSFFKQLKRNRLCSFIIISVFFNRCTNCSDLDSWSTSRESSNYNVQCHNHKIVHFI